METGSPIKNNPNCMLCGQPHCAFLNEESCEKCRVGRLAPERQAEAAEDVFYIAEALPEDGLESIMKGESCALCRGAEPAPATRIAEIDMAHEHPTHSADEKTDKQYDRSTSMVVPVQLPVCDECRKKLNLFYYLPLALGVFIALAGIVVTSLEPIRIPLARHGRALPFLVFLIFVFLGVIVESVAKKILRDRIEHSMNTRAKRIPALAELNKNGWFALGADDRMLNFTFLPARLESGIATGEGQKELLAEIRALGREGIKLMAERMAQKTEQPEQPEQPEEPEKTEEPEQPEQPEKIEEPEQPGETGGEE